MTKDVVLKMITDFYLQSRDFNGIRLDMMLTALADLAGGAQEDAACAVRELIAEGKVTLAFSSVSVNPHIKRFADLPLEDQLARLEREDWSGICAYPAEPVIRSSVDVSAYDDRPFTKRLLLGEPHLAPQYFDLEVLERYHTDPRYSYHFNDYDGSISVRDEYFESDKMAERDQVLLQTFGIGYDSEGDRVVVVFLRYLSDLSPEHQQIWNANVHSRACKMVYEYYQNSILAEWAECISVYEAILLSQVALNELASVTGKPPLFNETYASDRPRGFSTLLRPTLRSYMEFVHLLDKMLSENMNKRFFTGDVPLEETIHRRDGRIEVRQRGTLTVLDEWLHKTVRFQDEAPYRAIIGPLRQIRKLRQRPAHAVLRDDYDMAYIRQQDELVSDVYYALSGLCIVLSTHPEAKAAGYKLPDWLEESKVKAY
jgi:hypothetical protein